MKLQAEKDSRETLLFTFSYLIDEDIIEKKFTSQIDVTLFQAQIIQDLRGMAMCYGIINDSLSKKYNVEYSLNGGIMNLKDEIPENYIWTDIQGEIYSQSYNPYTGKHCHLGSGQARD